MSYDGNFHKSFYESLPPNVKELFTVYFYKDYCRRHPIPTKSEDIVQWEHKRSNDVEENRRKIRLNDKEARDLLGTIQESLSRVKEKENKE